MKLAMTESPSDRPTVPPTDEEWGEADNTASHILTLFSWWREIGLAAAAAAALGLAICGGLRIADPEYVSTGSVTLRPLKNTGALAAQLSARQAEMVGLVRHSAILEATRRRLGGVFSEEELEHRELLGAIEAKLANPEGRLKVSNMIYVSAIANSREKSIDLSRIWLEEFVRVANEHRRPLPDQYATYLLAVEDQENRYATAQETLTAFIESNPVDRLTRAIERKRATLDRLASVRVNAVSDALDLRRSLRRLIEEAEGLQGQIRSGGAASVDSNALTVTLLKAKAFASSTSLGADAEIVIGDRSGADDLASQRIDVESLVATLRSRYRRVEAALAAWFADPTEARLIEVAAAHPDGEAEGIAVAARMAELDAEVRAMEAEREIAAARRVQLEVERDRERKVLSEMEDGLRDLDIQRTALEPYVRPASFPIFAQRRGLDPFMAALAAGAFGMFAMLGCALILGAAGRRPPLARPAAPAGR